MNEAITFDDVLIVPRFSDVRTRKDCNLKTVIDCGDGVEFELNIPIIAANMDTICETKMAMKMADLGGLGILHRNMPIPQLEKAFKEIYEPATRAPVVAVGGVHTDKEKIDWLIANYALICVDMAHGHSQNMKDTLEYIISKQHLPIIAGNVCTPRGVQDLHAWGASIVKVGVGSGSVCTTRIKTGCGYPQLQAILDIVKETGGTIPIIADGGIRTPGDAVKALAAGANFVMLGGMLAATDCTPKWELPYPEYSYKKDMIKTVPFRGMASEGAKGHKTHVEGEQVFIKAKSEGSTEAVITDMCESIRSAMSYVGAHDLRGLWCKSDFIRVTNAVHIENQPHKVYDVE